MDFDRVATAWSRWWPHFERGAGAVSQRMMHLASLAQEDMVPDAATGLGEPALLAAKRVEESVAEKFTVGNEIRIPNRAFIVKATR